MGKPILCIFTCANFRPELAAAVQAEAWDDVVVQAIPARCGHPPLSWDEVVARLPENCSQVLLLGNACLGGLGTAPAGCPPVRIQPLTQCFHLIAGETLVDEAISGGGYLITPIWLANWPARLAALGFTPELAGECFREFAKELVYLDTGMDPAASTRLEELAAVLKLPARRLAVGLDTARLRLAHRVQEWRTETALSQQAEAKRRHGAELADHVAAMDLLQGLARTQSEAEAIAAIQDMFQMLFAPAALHYLPVENGVAGRTEAVPPALQERLTSLQTDYAWLEDRKGFLLRIRHGETLLGLLAMEGLAFPEYHQRYLNLALAVTGVCGLSIENARNRQRLLEAEKMASLGIVVAGVAHEVSTPLGVSLASSSTLEGHTRRLAERFKARTMTQSDLQKYLADAETCTGLIHKNLERIGQLVDAFRQVAVQGKALVSAPLQLRACLFDVLKSFGQRLEPAHVTVDIRCPPDLTAWSVAGDWASIFMNLISNSLKHGFRDRDGGRIDIAVREDGDMLTVDYRDDGVGLAPEVREHVFDPFFTTDLQRGMGLGMHLVYNLITHRLGGSIQCRSEPGTGVEFLIRVPHRRTEDTRHE